MIAALALGGCSAHSSSKPPPPPASSASTPSPTASPGVRAPIQAVALSPRGFPADYGELAPFFAEASTFPRAGFVWNGAWRDDVPGGAVPTGATLVATQAAASGATPIAVFGWRSGETPNLAMPTNATNDWSNADAALAYAATVASYAAIYQPAYVFLGNENDYYFERDATDYTRWIAAYDSAYDAIHAASPATLVGPVFQYEHLSGLGHLAAMTQNWGALAAHDLPRVDVVGISLYPFFSYATPEEVPDNYLAPLVDLLPDTPIVLTETGWPASKPDGFEAPWDASPELQAQYAAALPRLVAGSAGADVRAVTWLYLHPPVPASQGGLGGQAYDIFGSISLRDDAGEKRPTYDVWAGLDWGRS